MSPLVTLCVVSALSQSPTHPTQTFETLVTGSRAECLGLAYSRPGGAAEVHDVDLGTASGAALAERLCGEELRGCAISRGARR